MRCLITLSCLFVYMFIVMDTVLAQEAHVDSLERALRDTDDYNQRIRLLGELSDWFSTKDSDRAVSYALQLKELAKAQRDQRGEGIAHFWLAGVHYELFQIDSAMAHYATSEQLLEHDTTFLGQQFLARAWYNHGAQYQRKGDEETFLDLILNRSIPIYERIGDTLGVGRSFHNIGLIFQNNLEYQRAIYYYRKAIEMLDNYPGIPELIDAYCKWAEAAIYYLPNATPAQRDTIKMALRQADSLLQRYPDDMSKVMYISSMGMYEEAFENRLDKALEHYLQGHHLAKQSGLVSLSTSLLNRAYYIYDKQGKDHLALQASNQILEEYRNYMRPRDLLIQLRNQTNSLEKLGRIPDAYRIQKQYTALSDSLHDAEMAFKIHSLEQKFEAKEKEAQIMRLNQQMQQQQISAQQNRFWTTLLGGGILLVVGVSAAGYNIFRKKQLIVKQQAALLEQDMEKMKQEQHISVFAAMLEGQEQERKRLAIDLHDGLGGSLSSIKMKLSKVVQAQQDTDKKRELDVAVKQLDASVDELRHIARNLMPETLLKYGLAVSLGDFCKSLEQQGTRITFQSYGLREDMPRSLQIMVYRIIQELISNAIKHAGAKHILAQCLQQGHHLSITVEDDGSGFDSEQGSGLGMGLSNVQTRVTYLGGKLDMQSENGVGTTINIELTYDDE